MNVLNNFEHHLKILMTGNEYGEAVFQVLESILKSHPEFKPILEKGFADSNDDEDKETYAMLILFATPSDDFYKSYLIEHHDWEESDFE
ncbi:MAG: hypothetical protein OXT67_13850 [Zetaproteobacteria bacterium]|nr:hypothetical protein [Zetaproteobacteria bacterium]